MKFRVLSLLTAAVLLSTLRAADTKVGFIEEFALATDRERVLAQLIPGSEEFYFFHALHFQNTRQQGRLNDLLKQWAARFPDSERRKIIENRAALLAYDADPQATLQFLRERLNLQFTHERLVLDQPPNLPAALDQKVIALEQFIAEARHHNGLETLSNESLEVLLRAKVELSESQQRALLSRIDRPDTEGLLELIATDLARKESKGFGEFEIHRALLPEQLDALAKQVPSLLENHAFVHTRLRKLHPSADVDIEYNAAEREAWLERLWTYAGKLSPSFNTLKGFILYRRLDHDREQGVYNKARFLEYLKLPRQLPYVNPLFLRRQQAGAGMVNFTDQEAARILILPPFPTDEPLVRDYLLHLLKDEPSWEPYAQYLRDTYLKPIFAEAKIVNGIGTPEQWASLLSAPAFQELKERVDLDFPANAPKELRPADDVRLQVFVKNVRSLLVRIYEINELSFFLTQKRQLNTDLNLDGLIANTERTHEISDEAGQNPFRRVPRLFQFPELQGKRGAWIIEFIGGGKSSRALIRKGQWEVLQQIGPAGDMLTVVDEQQQVVKDAVVWLGGRRYTPDPELGQIIIPFTNEPGEKQIILADPAGTFASLTQFEHHAESYDLSAQFHIAREQLLSRREATVAIRTALLLGDRRIPLALLKEPRLTITATTLDDVSTTTEVKDVKLEAEKVFTHKFQVPDRLATLTVSLEAHIEKLSAGGKKEELEASESWEVNGIDKADLVADLHLTRLNDRYVLELLGKAGEPLRDRAIDLQFHRRGFNEPVRTTLRTDERGRIDLGALQDIARVSAERAGLNRGWSLADSGSRHPDAIHARAGEVISVAWAGPITALTRAHLSLLEKRAETFAVDRFPAVALVNGMLEIKGLPPGDYSLRLEAPEYEEITIRVTAGVPALNWIVSDSRFLELRNPPPAQITGLQAAPEKIVIQVKNVTPFTRVHVAATRFVPDETALSALSQFPIFTPGTMVPAQRPNIFVEGRNIGDEYRYILERRKARIFPGNMLTRPGLLLNPWELRVTDLEQLVSRGGEAARAGRDGRGVKRESQAKPENIADDRAVALEVAPEHEPSLDFLATVAPVLYNLKPDASGLVTIDRKALGDRQYVQVYVEDLHSANWRFFALPERATAFRDLRLTQSLDPQKRFTEAREVTLLAPGQTLKLPDVLASDIALYDSLASVQSLLGALLKDEKSKERLAKFNWLLQWPKLPDEEKRAKYSEFACHELNFFLWRKDPAFFQAVIQPYLGNKKDKTFMDEFLLNADLSGYVDPWRYARLNVVERALLGKRLPQEAAAAARHLRELWELLPFEATKSDFLFDVALRGRALEESAFGLAFQQESETLARRNLGARADAASGPATTTMAITGVPAPASAVAGLEIKDARHYDSVESQSQLYEWAEEKKQPVPGQAMGGFFDLGDVEAVAKSVRLREQVRQLFRSLGPTKEWAENNYYHLPIAQQDGDLIPLNAFWRDFAAWDNQGSFSSEHLAQAHSSFTEIVLALAVLDLPFDSAKHQTQVDDRQYVFTAGSPVLAYHKELREAAAAPQDAGELLVTENFYRKDDPVTHQGNEEVQKFVTDEFIAGVVYGGKVVVTNPTSASRRIQVLLQIPQGALPVAGSKATESKALELAPYSTKTLDYFFYFPVPGENAFTHYPVTASRDGALLGAAKPFSFRVVAKASQLDEKSWEYISQYGTEADAFAYLEKANLQRVELAQVAWRARTSLEFFRRIVDFLRQRHVYSDVLWSYAVVHNERGPLAEWLHHQEEFLGNVGPWLQSPLLTVDPIERRIYQHLEYSPLVNQRAHQFGGETHIVNPALRQQYVALMHILAHKGALDAEDRMSVVYYLFLQDRVPEALAWFATVEPQALPTQLQHDYFRCYAAFYEARLADARGVATNHLQHPVPRWRKLFPEVVAQLDEIENKAVERPADDQPNRELQQGGLAQTEPSFDFKVEDRKIILHWANLKEVTISFYLMDPELLFSSNPFVAQDPERFSIITPSKTLRQELPADRQTLEIPLTAEFQRANVLVEVVGAGQRKAQAYHANNLRITLAENYGRLELRDSAAGQPVSKAYVKVYARLKDGQVRFYKDGYTDLRGRFDYASLNSGTGGDQPIPPPRPMPVDGAGFDYQTLRPQELDHVDRLAILVVSDSHGALTREVAPPAK